jgi:plastocyanin
MRKHYAGLTVLGALALAATACAPAQPAAAQRGGGQAAQAGQQAAQAVTVTMTDLKFSPETVRVKAGTPVQLTAANKGLIEHNWVVEVGDETFQLDARPGQTASKTFTPTTPGTYTVVCTIPGHEQAGMKGTLIVE